MLEWLLALLLGGVVTEVVEMPPPEMACNGPMITMDPTFLATHVREGDLEVVYIGITNNCSQDLVIDLEFGPVQEGDSLGEIRLIEDPGDLALGGVVDELGLISLRLLLPAYETDVRALAFYADEIDVENPSFLIDIRWFDVNVIRFFGNHAQLIFHAESALEFTVYEVYEGPVGGGGN